MTAGGGLASLVACGLCVVPGAGAEPAARLHAQISTYQVKPGQDGPFVDAYVRHLGWHLKNADPWAWYIWRITNGSRRALYVGGSFGHPWEETDNRPRPEEDRQDHARTIDVHREGAGDYRILATREDLGGAAALLETSPSVAAFEYAVRPSARLAFEESVRSLAAGGGNSAADTYRWFEVVNGDRVPVYLLLVPITSDADLLRVRYDRFGARAEPTGPAAEARERALAVVESVRSEIWDFRPDASTCVLAKSGCVGVVPARK